MNYIKNLVGNDIVNSKPEQLSQNIISEIKNIKQGNIDIAPEPNNTNSVENNTNANANANVNNNSSILKKPPKASPPAPVNPSKTAEYSSKGEWSELVISQEKQKLQEIGIENNSMGRKQ